MRTTNRLPRREFLSVALGAPAVFSAAISDAQEHTRGSLRPIIFVWLDGGLTQLETFDPKPDAPVEIRGEGKAIRSKEGTLFGEQLPKLAALEKEFTILRAVQNTSGEHETGTTEFMGKTAFARYGGSGGLQYGFIHPSQGSRVYDKAHQTASADFRFQWKGGAFNCPNLETAVDARRHTERRALLKVFQRGAVDPLQHIAMDLLSGDAEKLHKAFTLNPRDVEAYAPEGANPEPGMPEAFLLAQQLAEQGLPFTTLHYGGWDYHNAMRSALAKRLPVFDHALATLIRQTRERRTVIAACSEFGRTPKINDFGGRDHWPNAGSALITVGSGVFGSTDRSGDAASGIVTPEKLRKTILAAAGHTFPLREYVWEIVKS
ncbi:DUF1501 domain-containing protein [Candidatus Peregrinibacteria bacterium]|nr:DUF1501 domain-containing protein [Candidatus Peregrinibacteria bacterium]